MKKFRITDNYLEATHWIPKEDPDNNFEPGVTIGKAYQYVTERETHETFIIDDNGCQSLIFLAWEGDDAVYVGDTPLASITLLNPPRRKQIPQFDDMTFDEGKFIVRNVPCFKGIVSVPGSEETGEVRSFNTLDHAKLERVLQFMRDNLVFELDFQSYDE